MQARGKLARAPASRGNEISRREPRAATRQAARTSSAPPALAPAASPLRRSLGEATQPQEPRAQARGQAASRNRPGASERRHNLPAGAKRADFFSPRIRGSDTRRRIPAHPFPQKKERPAPACAAVGGNASFCAGFQCARAASRAAFFLSHLRTGSGIVPPSS